MKQRTGKECKKKNCKNYKYYSHWAASIGESVLMECRNCKFAFVSQYQKEMGKVK